MQNNEQKVKNGLQPKSGLQTATTKKHTNNEVKSEYNALNLRLTISGAGDDVLTLSSENDYSEENDIIGGDIF